MLGLLLCSTAAATQDFDDAYEQCPRLPDPLERLVCFDSFVLTPATGPQLADEISRLSAERARLQQGYVGLSTHEPNKVLARSDGNDFNRLYMDATLSVKHPVLSPAVDGISRLFNLEQEQLPRLYLAFTSRFSQYIGSRASAPVVARSYNPELFLRVWRSRNESNVDPSYWDFAYGHESNGQRINNAVSFEQEKQSLLAAGQLPLFARDSISRGWDYVSVDWHRQWDTGFLPNLRGRTETHIEYRHFLEDGLFQGVPEEAYEWEGVGVGEKPRARYDGLEFSMQYNLINQMCSQLICFEKVELAHQTGYANPFANNTTTLEVTTNIGGLPLHLWARSGYNSDLVDYFRYSNSWGFGVEFLR